MQRVSDGPERQSLTGWGRTAPTFATVEAVGDGEVARVIGDAGSRGLIPRGLGRSYGDAAQNAGGSVVSLVDSAPAIDVDEAALEVTTSAGTSLDQLMRALLPHGLFVQVTPGTRHVTVGGAIAADIHGKNHHVDGSFGNHVKALTLIDGTGERRRLDPGSTPELFWATVGGMGLTGVIVDATVSIRRVETSLMSVDTTRQPDLDALLDAMAETDDGYTYSVAWIDLLARGRSMGRSVLTQAEHAPIDALPGRRRNDALSFAPRALASVPAAIPASLIGKQSVKIFNESWFRKSPQRRTGELVPLGSFFHPLDGVANWNRLYGPRGLTQYQFVVPFGAERALRDAIEQITGSGHASFLAVLKRFGAGNPAPLSFPMAGWTLALDLPAKPSLWRLLDDLDEIVAHASGRIYLAKDGRARPDTIAAMYPRLEAFAAARAELDPKGVFRSDLSRRLLPIDGVRQ